MSLSSQPPVVTVALLLGKKPQQPNILSREHGWRCSALADAIAAGTTDPPISLVISSGGTTLRESASEAELGAEALQAELKRRGQEWEIQATEDCLQEAKRTGGLPTKVIVLEAAATVTRLNSVRCAEFIADLCKAVGLNPNTLSVTIWWTSQAYHFERTRIRERLIPERADGPLMRAVLPQLSLQHLPAPYPPLADPNPQLQFLARVYVVAELSFDAILSNLSGLKRGEAPAGLRPAALARAREGVAELRRLQGEILTTLPGAPGNVSSALQQLNRTLPGVLDQIEGTLQTVEALAGGPPPSPEKWQTHSDCLHHLVSKGIRQPADPDAHG